MILFVIFAVLFLLPHPSWSCISSESSMSWMALRKLLNSSIKDFQPESVNDFDADRTYYCWWRGDGRTRAEFYDEKIITTTGTFNFTNKLFHECMDSCSLLKICVHFCASVHKYKRAMWYRNDQAWREASRGLSIHTHKSISFWWVTRIKLLLQHCWPQSTKTMNSNHTSLPGTWCALFSPWRRGEQSLYMKRLAHCSKRHPREAMHRQGKECHHQ